MAQPASQWQPAYNADGSFTYTPNVTPTAATALLYRATTAAPIPIGDGRHHHRCVTMRWSLWMHIAPPLNEDAPLQINVLANDAGRRGAVVLTTAVVTGPANGDLRHNVLTQLLPTRRTPPMAVTALPQSMTAP
ncbi:MAG: hypothetical protein KF778_21465 [Rhodocyclaceae bacterium]|nr:hypothetical protein [Rhodocyclaceae bacterium]